MTTEQREAVEFLEFYKQHCLKKEIENMDNYETIHDGDFVSKNLDTVLSLIKEQSAELLQKNAEIEKKDKQIDLMSRAIDNYDSQLEINTFKDKEDIKQYFERKATDENNKV